MKYRNITELAGQLARLRGTTLSALRSSSRTNELVRARDTVSYVLGRLGFSHQEIGDVLNRDRSSIGYAQKRVESCFDLSFPYAKWIAQDANEALEAIVPDLCMNQTVNRIELKDIDDQA